MSMNQDWTIAVAGIATGALMTIAGFRYSRWIAVKSGAFRAARINVRLFGMNLQDESGAKAAYFLHPGGDDDASLGHFDLAIENTGDGATGNLLVVMTANRELFVTDPEAVRPASGVRLSALGIERSAETKGNFAQVSYLVPSIRPKTGAQIREPCILKPTSISADVKAKTKDAVDVVVKTTIHLEYVVTVAVYPEDDLPVAASIRVGVLAANSHQELAQQLLQRSS